MSISSVGKTVRAAREAKGLTRAQLAELTDVSASTLLRLEVHEQVPTTARLFRIARSLELDLEDLAAALDMTPETSAA